MLRPPKPRPLRHIGTSWGRAAARSGPTHVETNQRARRSDRAPAVKRLEAHLVVERTSAPRAVGANRVLPTEITRADPHAFRGPTEADPRQRPPPPGFAHR